MKKHYKLFYFFRLLSERRKSLQKAIEAKKMLEEAEMARAKETLEVVN